MHDKDDIWELEFPIALRAVGGFILSMAWRMWMELRVLNTPLDRRNAQRPGMRRTNAIGEQPLPLPADIKVSAVYADSPGSPVEIEETQKGYTWRTWTVLVRIQQNRSDIEASNPLNTKEEPMSSANTPLDDDILFKTRYNVLLLSVEFGPDD